MPNQSKQGLLSPFLQKIRFKEISKNIKKDFSNLNEVDVLDYGCGDGYFSNIFSKEKYVGYDLDENIIYKNKKREMDTYLKQELMSKKNLMLLFYLQF